MGKGLSWFAMLLSAAALVAAGFTWYQTQIVALQNETKLSVGVSEIGTQVSRLGDAMTRLQQDQASVVSEAELNNQLLKIQHNVEAGLATLQDRQSELDQSVTRIITDMQTGANKFVLDEVSHLLRIANNSVLFGGNAIGAANAMSAAEDLLKSLSNPMYAPLRIAINQEVTQLQAVQQPDFTALSVGLRAVRKSVPLLPLANEPDELQAVNSSLAKEPVESWQAAVSEMWSDLTQLVQVKRVDQPPKPLLAPEQRYFLNQNLQLQLSAAELALMQQNEEAYNGSIEDAVHWLKQYFDLSDKKVQAALKQLASNEAQQFETELPDISGSYQILQSLQDGQ